MSLNNDGSFTKFLTLVTIEDADVQNVQELTRVWGQVREEFNDLDATLEDTYAVLGEVDFAVIFEAPTTDVAFKAGVTLQRHGLDAQTMEVTPTDRFGELVEDL
jgi:uncharacterized protein with GYD domain